MKNNLSQNEVALSDIEYMRKFLDGSSDRIPDQTEMMITALVCAIAFVLFILFAFVNPELSRDILMQEQNSNLRTTIMTQIAIVLSFIGFCVYGLAWRRARELQSSLNRTLGRSLKFLKLESFLPDLLLKAFVLFMTVIAAPQFLPALLVAFTADYVLQGRFFNLGQKFRIPVGVLLYIGATQLFVAKSESLVIPLAVFTITSAISLISIIVSRRRHHG